MLSRRGTVHLWDGVCIARLGRFRAQVEIAGVPDEAALQRPKAAAALVSLAASAEEIGVLRPRTFMVVGAVNWDCKSSF